MSENLIQFNVEDTEMNKETHQALFDHAVRWTNNMLVEVIANHSQHLSEYRRQCLRTALSSLQDAMRPEPKKEEPEQGFLVEEGQTWASADTKCKVSSVETVRGATVVNLELGEVWPLRDFLRQFHFIPPEV